MLSSIARFVSPLRTLRSQSSKILIALKASTSPSCCWHEFIEGQVPFRIITDLFQVTESVSFVGICGACAGDISGPSNIAIHRVLLLFSHTYFRVMVKGTLRTTPIRPSRPPQKIRERNTTSVDRPSLRPLSIGSTTLPRMNSTARYPIAASEARPIPNWIKARKTAGTAAIMAPTLGTYFRVTKDVAWT